jgi:hypothetical protein
MRWQKIMVYFFGLSWGNLALLQAWLPRNEPIGNSAIIIFGFIMMNVFFIACLEFVIANFEWSQAIMKAEREQSSKANLEEVAIEDGST